jgi:acyl-CoA reductase-like NAD-dependent aldehyde dehydrogenase
VDRAIDGVRWYVDESDRMLDGRAPLPGPVSNIASWNYPMSVLVHAMLVQPPPTAAGLPHPRLRVRRPRGPPLTLVSGSGSELSEALVRSPEIGCVSFVGGRDTGAAVATAVVDLGKHRGCLDPDAFLPGQDSSA